jgi:hypothetical protein
MLAEQPIDVMLLGTDLVVTKEFYGERVGLGILIGDRGSSVATLLDNRQRHQRQSRPPAPKRESRSPPAASTMS